MRSVSSVKASTGAQAYASLIRIALNEKPSTPTTANASPIELPLNQFEATSFGRRELIRASYPCRAASSRAACLGPLHQPGISGAENHQTEGDAIPGEGDEVVVGDVAQQPAHDQESAYERGDESHADHRQIAGREKVAVLHEFVARGGKQGRNREEERELGRRSARQAEHHGSDDRRAGARRAGNERQRLRKADL